MITSIDEIRHVRKAVDKMVRRLNRARVPIASEPALGVMIETPGAALAADALANAQAHAPKSSQPARNATAYVSMEPCCTHGATPPCADALIDAGIQRVVAPSSDPNPRVHGRGFERLRNAGVQVHVEEMPEARELNPGWFKRMRTGRPWVRLKSAMSLDGRTAMASGESRWITGEAARADVQYWRARSCAIVTGAGTVRDDDPRLNVRDARFSADGRTRQPLRVVVSSRGDIPKDAAVFKGEGTALVACGKHGPIRHPHAEVQHQEGERVDLSQLLDQLGARECNEVLVEAGPALAGAFLDQRLWDEWVLYLAPKFLGSEARPLAELRLARLAEAVAGRIIQSKMIGEDLRLVVRR